jgi:hypothetical protein
MRQNILNKPRGCNLNHSQNEYHMKEQIEIMWQLNRSGKNTKSLPWNSYKDAKPESNKKETSSKLKMRYILAWSLLYC